VSRFEKRLKVLETINADLEQISGFKAKKEPKQPKSLKLNIKQTD